MNPTAKDHGSPPDFTDAAVVAGRMQSTLISNTVTEAQWRRHISECIEYRFHAAMIPGSWVRKTVEELRGTGVRVASFIDLPLGTMTSTGKAREAGVLLQDGVQEIDLMPNVGFLLSGMEREYFNDVRGVVQAAARVPIKIMLELPLLSMQQRERAIALGIEAGVEYLKNASSGAVGIATPSDMIFLRRLAPPNIKLKASGGIKTAGQVRSLLEAGADLVGTSAATQIMREWLGKADVLGGFSNPAY